MENREYQAFLGRINAVSDPTVGKIIYDDIMMSRHNYFGRELCGALGIQYRNDVPLVDILLDTVIDFDPINMKVPNITPDNYYYRNGILYLIDYKVSVSDEATTYTYNKYYDLTRELDANLDVTIEVVVIRVNPMTKEIYCTVPDFLNNFNMGQLELNFDRFLELKDMLFEKFRDDDDFHQQVGHGDFTLTAPWCVDGCKDLYSHPIYKEFKYSMNVPGRRLFEESVNFNSYSGEKWNVNLIKVKDFYENDYNDYIQAKAKEIFTIGDTYPRPSSREIEEGWALMKERVLDQRDVIKDPAKQKPSVHLIWSPGNPDISNKTIDKLIIYSKILQKIEGASPHKNIFQAIGRMMDIKDNITEYESFCDKLKTEARKSNKQVQNKKIQYQKIGDATVCWEQQFLFTTEYTSPIERSKFFKEFLGIGGHKVFSYKDENDTKGNLEKPKILDFDDTIIKIAASKMVKSTKNFLSSEKNFEILEFILEYFGPNIKSCSEENFKTLKDVMNTNFWACLNDFSVLVKNILAVSQYNKHNTFRIAMCANNCLFAIIYPSADIKTRRATVVFSTVTLHKDKDSVLNCGALHQTFKVPGGYLSMSKAIRLDKERCQRIVTSPGLFLMNCLLLYNNNDTIDIKDVMTFSFFTSLSITKAMLSLTEPSRYMIMNSLAISSNVKGYIEDKFSPYTKTLFSVHMTNLIKNGCMNAYLQRDKIAIRDIFMTDYDIKQKGVKEVRNINSIWFPGMVDLKEYLNQVYLPFYYNAKGLHEKHHVIIDLAKTVLEIEQEQRVMIQEIWSQKEKKQTVNLPILVHSLCKNLLVDTTRKNYLRSRIETMNNFRRPITTISTFTSSKSCIKVGDFREFKSKAQKKSEKAQESHVKKMRVANPLFFEEEKRESKVVHASYEHLIGAVPNYVDYMSVKVFDRLYEKIKDGEVDDRPSIELIMDTMVDHRTFYFSFFNKGQKTAKDREIFVGEFEVKMCLYCLERISKERCKVNPDEMISQPGDGKLKVIEQKAEAEIRFLVEKLRGQKKKIEAELLQGIDLDFAEERLKGLVIQINADMSKWSAQDVLYKYFWLVALDPILYPQEKERILFFLCNYMQKRLLMPDELMCNILDQKVLRDEDIIMEMTEQLSQNYVEIKRNWLQGNLNYTSSYLHSCAMSVYKDVIKKSVQYLDGEVLVNSLVHSDDNQTSLIYIQNKIDDDIIISHAIEMFEKVCMSFGNQVNRKKTYITNILKEFVSLFNIYGEPFSIVGRFLLTSVGDCSYTGPYEDLSSRLSSAQTALKHGAKPSLIWLSIGISHWITYMTYNMLPGQVNDPLPFFPCSNRTEIPIELGGILNSNLSMTAIVGLEAGNLNFLINLLKKYVPVEKKRETITVQCSSVAEWDISQMSTSERFYLKVLRHLVLDDQISSDDTMGETSDMRSRSILTPRKFTTIGSLRRLVSFNDYQNQMQSKDGMSEIFQYMLDNPELLVTKGETVENFLKMIIYRFNSKRFKESLSIQNPAQLFIEQMLFSRKPVIDFNGIREKYLNLIDSVKDEENPGIIGRVTYQDAYRLLIRDLNSLNLTNEDIEVVYSYVILNDPLMTTVANIQLLSIIANPQQRMGLSCNSMPEFRNMRLIKNSPALVLRAYSHSTTNIGNCDPREMERDLYHLKEFIEATNLEGKMIERIQNRQKEKGSRDLQFEVKETTAFYQICYSYIKSTEHRIKIFILPMKAQNTVDFCSLIQGNTISDRFWYTIHYLKPILSTKAKGVIQRTPLNELNIAKECFKLIAHFGDIFIAEESRSAFLQRMIREYSYKDLKVEYLYNMLIKDNSRIQFLPLLFRTGDLTQKDVDKFDALKNSERVTWNQWQISRTMDIGTIDLVITGQNRQIAIKGKDNMLEISELLLNRVDQDNILFAGRKLLNARHGLRFEKFLEHQIEPGNYYITYQKKGRGQYTYQIHHFNSIVRRQSDYEQSSGRMFNRLVPVCPVNVGQVAEQSKINIRTLDYMNNENFSLSRIIVSQNEYATVRKSSFAKMPLFEGPPMQTGMFDVLKLMKSPELMSLDYNDLVSTSLVSFAKMLSCSGSPNIEEDMLVFSDDPMEVTEETEIFCNPVFTIKVSKQGEKSMSYRNALLRSIHTGADGFMSAFCWDTDGFISETNLGILESLVSIMRILKTNEWSSILENCIHICMIKNNMDTMFHTFDMPEAFLINKYTQEINWLRLRDFLKEIPGVREEPWGTMFEHFRNKSLAMIEKEMKPRETFDSFKQVLKKKGGKSMFVFEA
ncbi:L [Termeil virus]|uniref:RNA-directed RNA polymerase L n=1 Tax=Termeil virus TaxID=2748250 RepID=A0A7D9MVT6_9VIRU|nr:L [Termeil virus] [Termeil virus]QLA47018.1 L [Termeil virus] [Termeil virus]